MLQHQQPQNLAALRAHVWRTDPCLAWIIDNEQGHKPWSATVYNGGDHWQPGDQFDSSRSYGLPQADPGTKMASAGPDWKTNPVTQLRWAVGYMNGRYGSSCGAKAFWESHGWY